MTTMELDSQRLMLAREILTTDNAEFLKEMTKAYKRIKNRLADIASTKEMEAEPDSKEYILNGMKEAINSLNDYKAGKIQARPLDELIRELETEEE